MGGLDRGAVAAAHDAWVFEPAGSEVVETAEYRLARFPDRFGFTPQVQWIRSARPVEVVLAEALARVAEFGRPEATVTVRPSAPAGLVEALLARGALRDNTGDVLALALPAGLEAPEIAGLELRWATEPEVGRDVGAIGIAVFGGHPASEEVVAQRAAATRESVDAGAGGSMVAYLDGAAAGFATVEIVGGVARLAGGGVLEPHRGRGVYRALVAARLAYAGEQGATMALSSGNVTTNSPILQRLGFVVFGQEHFYRLPVR
jgi:GNAT superfamily N-acetyltransferase